MQNEDLGATLSLARHMAKIHPSPSSSNLANSMKEVYTIWMKSLILNSNGCTIYDSRGNLVYRVDNYDSKCRCEVYVMDHSGRVLLKLLRKVRQFPYQGKTRINAKFHSFIASILQKLRVFGRWEGYKCNSSNEEMKPWFRVKKPCRFLEGKESSCEVWDDEGHLICYKVVGMAEKSSYKIIDLASNIVAEVGFSHMIQACSVLSKLKCPQLNLSFSLFQLFR